MGEAPEDTAKRLEGRLKKLTKLFHSTAYRTHDNGDTPVVTAAGEKPTRMDSNDNSDSTSGSSGMSDGRKSNLADRLRKKLEGEGQDLRAKKIKDLQVPEISWVDGHHDDQLRDCAAKYDAIGNRLIINENFRGFKSFLAHIQNEYIDPKAPNKDTTKFLTDLVKEYYSQVLVEAVWGVLNLSEKGAFLREDYITNYLTPQGLTMAVQAKAEIRDNVVKAMRHKGYRMRATDDRSPGF